LPSFDTNRSDPHGVNPPAPLPTNSYKLEKRPWEHRLLVTWKDYGPAELENLESLSEAERAGFGHYVLARLMAGCGAAV